MKVDTECVSVSDKVYNLSQAIMLYRENQSLVFASIHNIDVVNGTPVVKPGAPVSKIALFEIMRALAPDEYMPEELLGSHILARGNRHMVWFSKPQKRQLWFNSKEVGGDVTAKTANPGLVFMVSENSWFVFAIKGNGRPDADTPLYVAPYLNVWEGGKICSGNIDIPKGSKRFDSVAWEECFFRSYFTHTNIHEKSKQTKFKGGIYALWRSLLKGNPFPSDALVPAGMTLGQAYEKVVRHGSA